MCGMLVPFCACMVMDSEMACAQVIISELIDQFSISSLVAKQEKFQ
jgi:hypothetical protein